jgi:adenosylcobinamide hydrolase
MSSRCGVRVCRGFVHVDFGTPMLVLSSTVYGGGLGMRRGFFVVEVHKNFSDDNPAAYLERFAPSEGLCGFMTAATLPERLYRAAFGTVEVFATVGLTNPCVPGDECTGWGTVNLAVVIRRPLGPEGLVNALATAVEAKAYALTKRCGYPGTTSDATLVAAYPGREMYAGSATSVGRDIGRAVRAIFEGVECDR